MKIETSHFEQHEKQQFRRIAISIWMASMAATIWLFAFTTDLLMLLGMTIVAASFLFIGFHTVTARTEKEAGYVRLIWCVVTITSAIFGSLPAGVFFVHPIRTVLNYLIAFMVVDLYYIITAHWRRSVILGSGTLLILNAVNYFVYMHRGKELVLIDVLSVRTAANVIDQYDFKLPGLLIVTLGLWIACLFAQAAMPAVLEKPRKVPYGRLKALGALAVSVLVLFTSSINIDVHTWDRKGTNQNGFLLNFFLSARTFTVKKPKDYTPEKFEEMIEPWVAEEKEEGSETAEISGPQLPPGKTPIAAAKKNPPNIIVIMNESFSDFNIFDKKPVTNIPVTPFIDSLQENTVKGYALSSVFGGNTANSEFEFLTGHSLAFLPSDSVAYQQYISEEIYSMAWLMQDLGYATYATHPYYASGWSREMVYPMLGFEEFTFLEDYEELYPQNVELLREYVSDKAMFSHVLDKLNSKEEGQPLFVMGITMQNHGGYLYEGDNYIQTVQLLETEDEYPKAEQYLSVIHETDKAVEYLLTELENYPEDTIVLFFGDHFPKVETEFYEELNGDSFDTLENRMLQYKIPFFIWANYDIPEKTVDCTSISYLGRYLLETAGLEMPAYYSMLRDIEQLIPAINAYGYYSIAQERFIPVDEATEAERNMLLMYESIQYNNLHDKKHRSEELYGQYMHLEEELDETPENGLEDAPEQPPETP